MTYKKNKFAKSKAYKPKTGNANYIDKEELFDMVVKYQAERKAARDAGKPMPKMPDSIGRAMLMIASKMAESANFRRYEFKDDLIMDACKNMVRYFDNFSAEKSHNVFSYWTQISYYAFLQRIGKERDRIYNDYQLRNSSRFAVIQEFGYADGNDLDNGHGEDGIMQDTGAETEAMKTFVEKYESARERKKAEHAAKATKSEDDT